MADPKAADLPKSAQQAAFEQWMGDVAGAIERVGSRLSQVDETHRRRLEDGAKEITRLSDEVTEMKSLAAKRFAELVAQDRSGGTYCGHFGSRAEAAHIGRLCIALGLARADPTRARAEMGELQKAAVIGGDTGPGGGALLLPATMATIFQNVERYGVSEQDALIWPMGAQTGSIIVDTTELEVAHPDIATAPTPETTTLSRVSPNLTTWQVPAFIENGMLRQDLVVPLAEFIAEKLSRGMARGQDRRVFIGTGTAAFGRVLGQFIRTDVTRVTAVSGDNTFAEIIAKSTDYLASVIGLATQRAEATGLAWYGHRSIFFGYAGVRDTYGRPITDIILAPSRPQMYLCGYPYRVVQCAPSASATTQASTTMLILSALRDAVCIARDLAQAEFRQSDQYKFLERITTFSLELRQDIVCPDPAATVQLTANAN